MKVKIFESTNYKKLEHEINLWLSSWSIKILDKQVLTFYYDAEAYTQIIIWYHEL